MYTGQFMKNSYKDDAIQINFSKTLVHCSAGTGRTGTLISAYCMVESLLHI